MKISLMRHGEAQKPMVAYQERNLTPAGEVQAANAGMFLRLTGQQPDIIIHSGQLRSKQSAQCVQEALGAGQLIKRDDLEEDSSPEEFLARLVGEYISLKTHLLVVGHNPFITRLCCRMLTGASSMTAVEEFTTGTLCGLESSRSGKFWYLRFFITQEMLGSVGWHPNESK